MLQLLTREEAEEALREAYAKNDTPATYFWTGYLLALPK